MIVNKYHNKFLRAIRLDDSDAQVYQVAAQPGEWAIPGTFTFWDVEPAVLSGKARQAFLHGFLGIGSFGWSTLVMIAPISPEELDTITIQLARHLVEHFGAPDIETALPAAREEIDFTVNLCEHDLHTMLAMDREYNDNEITENFKIIHPPDGVDHSGLRLWGADPEGVIRPKP